MERLGRYQIEGELGRGSMSIVYEALDPHINRHLAVKVLREHYARDVKSRQRFLREARSAGGLSHPNIVTVFDVGQVDGFPYLVMERLRGRSLDEFLADGHALTVRQIIDIGIQLAGALHYAHERGVIHRDIKPSNIFFDADSGLVKLVDFGIAAIEHNARTSEDDSVAGTPRYMAPEQILGDKIDGRADLYALGVVLYRLLGDRLPFDAEPIGQLAHQILNQPPPKLQPRHERTPVELIELVRRLLAKQPDTRHDDGTQVLEELQEIRADMDRGLLHSARRTTAAWRWPLALSLLLAVVLGSGLAWIYQSQSAAITETAYGYGDALASVIARETAEALLLEDATALSNLVADFSINPRITHLHVSNQDGVVQASTDPFLQGENTPEAEGKSLERERSGVRLVALDNGHLEFQTPVRFQARRIGQVQLGIDGHQLQAAAQTTLWMLVVVFLVSVTIVAAGFAWLWRWQQRSIQRIGWGLQRIARGQYDFRLDPRRQDVLASLYRRFNDMATRLEERHRHEQGRNVAPDLETRSNFKTRSSDNGVDETAELVPDDDQPNVLSIGDRRGGKPPEDS